MKKPVLILVCIVIILMGYICYSIASNRVYNDNIIDIPTTHNSQNTDKIETTTINIEETENILPIAGNFNNNLAAGGIACAVNDKVLVASSSKGSISEVTILEHEGNKKILGEFYARYMNTDGKYLFYCSNEDPVSGGNIHKYNLETNEDEVIFEGYASFLILKDDCLYFCDYSEMRIDKSRGMLTRIKTNGSEKTVLSEAECSYLIIIDDWIYYFSYTIGSSYNIMKMTINGEQEQKLIDIKHKPLHLNYEDDYLYWIDNHQGNIIRAKIDGLNREELITGEILSFIVNDGILYYTHLAETGIGMELTKKNLVADELEKLHEYPSYTEDLSLVGDWLYFYFESAVEENSTVTARININTGEIERIAEPILPG